MSVAQQRDITVASITHHHHHHHQVAGVQDRLLINQRNRLLVRAVAADLDGLYDAYWYLNIFMYTIE